MSLPGPGFVPWAIALAAWAAGFAVAGELLRRIASRYAPAARTLRPVELVIVDLYLGGGVLFVIAVVPFGLFYPFAPALVIALAVAALAGWFVADRRRGRAWDLRRTVAAFRAPPVLVALGAALALFLVELWTATSVPTGNTFDSSMLTYYVGHLETYRTVPFNFLPATPFANPYPQGTTAWIAAYQGSFGLPPARASLLVTPLFLGLAPLGAYAVGDRLLGTPLAGATFAVAFAFVGSWTRVLVGGSNDFVLAFPLVLVLFARVGVWTGRTPLSWGDALGFGALVGVGVSLNPAGPIWLLLTILFLGVAAGPRSLGRLAAWFGRWLLALGTGVVFALPSLAEEVTGPGGLFHRGVVAGSVASPGVPGGISVAQFFGLADPFLFRGTDVWLSPFPLLRDELAVLIALGAAVLLFPRWTPGFTAESREFGRSVLAGGAVAFGILLAGVAVDTGATGLGPFLGLTSFAETSILLFTIYTMVAAVPAYLLLRHADRRL
ncbi:MAG TPA: hypothetical protein VGS23_09320, partial [Thermoplasmata archaeon]|nr:hypothetical protein [Thermoplasmata archaeon]